ncbi:MAG TPA: hypothetical protein VI032_02625 [Burkholderiaceae bacterium]
MRLQRQCGLARCDGSVAVTARLQHPGQHVVGVHRIRRQPQRLSQRRLRLGMALQFNEHVAEVGPGGRVVRIVGHRLPQRLRSRVEQALVDELDAPPRGVGRGWYGYRGGDRRWLGTRLQPAEQRHRRQPVKGGRPAIR